MLGKEAKCHGLQRDFGNDDCLDGDNMQHTVCRVREEQEEVDTELVKSGEAPF